MIHETHPESSDAPTATTTTPATPFGAPSAAVERRIAIVEAAMRVFSEHAFHEASFELVARAVDLPVKTVRDEFTHWNGLVLATVDLWVGRRTRPLLPLVETHGTIALLRAIVVANAAEPALMRLLSATVNVAATPGHPLAPLLHDQWQQFYRLIHTSLVRDVDLGREPETMQPARGAEQLIALYEGLQLQSMVRRDMDVLDSFDRAITRLRAGWGSVYVPPAWDLELV
ncbi:TetR family transcriptional regulator [Frigoribacterium sp. VKM Ac-2836]|uniref:TetR/AcrR family transcriptional regulator n=1 Tax=Frigoribacterium sp. VKM Ac-2836 TaxID=2739014 RepID=UPI0015660736|nr:TetR/AcrR family transcriptional regulator [Frigoribacterium sp. VKM Ac-2836]